MKKSFKSRWYHVRSAVSKTQQEEVKKVNLDSTRNTFASLYLKPTAKTKNFLYCNPKKKIDKKNGNNISQANQCITLYPG